MDRSKTYRQRDDDRDRYREWLDTIFELVRDHLGGDAGQSGADRHYGRARFGYDMRSDDGDFVFAITRTRDDGTRARRDLKPLEWRAFTPSIVADLLVAAYDALATAAP